MAKRRPTAPCKLCLNVRELCESHIVSRLFWRRAGIAAVKGAKYDIGYVGQSEPVEKNRQDGIKEYLLCKECEDKIEVWEKHAEYLFYDAKHNIIAGYDLGFSIGGFNYQKIKLFFMSLLWRMSISSHFYYDAVTKELGERNRERLRKMLLASDTGDVWRYGTLLTIVRHGGKYTDAIMSAPKKLITKNGTTAFMFILAGVQVHIFTSRVTEMPKIEALFPQPSGVITFLVAEATELTNSKDELAELFTHVSSNPSIENLNRRGRRIKPI